MKVCKLSLNNAEQFLKNLNCDLGGVKIMSKKTGGQGSVKLVDLSNTHIVKNQ